MTLRDVFVFVCRSALHESAVSKEDVVHHDFRRKLFKEFISVNSPVTFYDDKDSVKILSWNWKNYEDI